MGAVNTAAPRSVGYIQACSQRAAVRNAAAVLHGRSQHNCANRRLFQATPSLAPRNQPFFREVVEDWRRDGFDARFGFVADGPQPAFAAATRGMMRNARFSFSQP